MYRLPITCTKLKIASLLCPPLDLHPLRLNGNILFNISSTLLDLKLSDDIKFSHYCRAKGLSSASNSPPRNLVHLVGVQLS
jgi:hypothetical protein